MKVLNIHERQFNLPPEQIGKAIDSLAKPSNILWPVGKWPPMEMDKGLCEGASGGHSFIKYSLIEYTPGKRAVFQFDQAGALAAFDGRHYFEVVPRRDHVLLRHVLEGESGFKDWILWHLFIGPLHNALLEDGLDLAENSLTGSSKVTRCSLWVKSLLFIIARQQAKKSD